MMVSQVPRLSVRILAVVVALALAFTLLPPLGNAPASAFSATGTSVFPSGCTGHYYQTSFASNEAICANGRVGPNPISGSIGGDSTVHLVPVGGSGSAAEQRIVRMGTFLDYPIAPEGVAPGEYRLMVDEMSTGDFRPQMGDYVYPEVLVVRDEEISGYSFDMDPIKDRARSQAEHYKSMKTGYNVMFGALVGIRLGNMAFLASQAGIGMGSVVFSGLFVVGAAAVGIPSVYNVSQWASLVALGNLIDAKIEANEGLANDPADPDYDRVDAPDLVEAEAHLQADLPDELLSSGEYSLPFTSYSDDPVSLALAPVVNASAEEAALVHAVMHSHERFHGAQDADNLAWTLAHAYDVRDHAEALAETYVELEDALDHAATVADSEAGEEPITEDDIRDLQDGIDDAGLASVLRATGFDESARSEFRDTISAIEPSTFSGGRTFGDLLREWAEPLDGAREAYVDLANEVGEVIAALEDDFGAADLPEVTVDAPDTPVEAGKSVTLSAHADGGEGALELDWDLTGDGAFDDASGDTADVSFDTGGAHPVAARVTDERGVQRYERAWVEVTHEPVEVLEGAPAEETIDASAGDELTLSVTGTGADDASWYAADEPVGSGASVDLTVPDRAGLWTVDAVVEGDDGAPAAMRSWVVAIAHDADGPVALSVARDGADAVAAGEDLGEVQVHLRDADGDPVARDGEDIELTLVPDDNQQLAPGAGLTGDAVSATGADGTVTFSDVAVSDTTPPGDYRVEARHTDGWLESGTSQVVTVTAATAQPIDAEVHLDGLPQLVAPGDGVAGALDVSIDDPDEVIDGDVVVGVDLRDPDGDLADPGTSVLDDVLADFDADPAVLGEERSPDDVDGLRIDLDGEAVSAGEHHAVWVATIATTDGTLLAADTAALTVREPVAGDPEADVSLAGVDESAHAGETLSFSFDVTAASPDELEGDAVADLDVRAVDGEADAATVLSSLEVTPDVLGEPLDADELDDGLTLEVTAQVDADAVPGSYAWRAEVRDDRGLLAADQTAFAVPAPPASPAQVSADLGATAAHGQGDAFDVPFALEIDDPDGFATGELDVAVDLRDPSAGDLLDPATSVHGDVVASADAVPDVLGEVVDPGDLEDSLDGVVSVELLDDAMTGSFAWVLEVRESGGDLVVVAAEAQEVGVSAGGSVAFSVSGNDGEHRPEEDVELVVEVTADDPAGLLDDELAMSWDLRRDSSDPATSVRDEVFAEVTYSPSTFFDEPVWTPRLSRDGQRVAIRGRVAFDTPESDHDGFALVLEARDSDGELVARHTADSLVVGDGVALYGTGGPVMLTGIDPEQGHVSCNHGCLDTWQDVIRRMLEHTRGPGSGALVIGVEKDASDRAATWWTTMFDGDPDSSRSGVPETGLGVEWEAVKGADAIADVDFNDYQFVGVATVDSQVSGSGGLDEPEEVEALTARASDIATFINRGGGWMGHTMNGRDDSFDYITDLFDVETRGHTFEHVDITDEGFEAGFDESLESVWAWHEVFEEFPDFLEVLAWTDDSSRGTAGEAAVIGGRQVGVPTGISLEPVRVAADPGEEVELRATVEEDEAPAPDVEVDFHVTNNGPGRYEVDGGDVDGDGHLGTATTDDDGVATVTLATAGVGTDEIEASFVDDGGHERVSNIATVRRVPFDSALEATPNQGRSRVGERHRVTAVLHENGEPAEGREVAFVIDGEHEGEATETTDASGRATFSYRGSSTGEDAVAVTAVDGMDQHLSEEVSVVWRSAREDDDPRVGGAERTGTAAEAAREAFPDGADAAVVAVDRRFPDALAGSRLAGRVEGPVLLTAQDALSAPTEEVLDELGVGRVYVLGGPEAVSEPVAGQLRDLGYEVQRIGGVDRYETARLIAGYDGGEGGAHESTALLATGERFPDALAGGPLAFAGGSPLLLSPSDELSEYAAEALTDPGVGVERVLVLGGEAAVAEGVVDEVEALGVEVERVAGADRTATAAVVAERTSELLEWPGDRVLLASGGDFADALTAAPLAGRAQAPLLLTHHGGRLGQPTRGYLDQRCDDLEEVTVVGGPAVVTPATASTARGAAACDAD